LIQRLSNSDPVIEFGWAYNPILKPSCHRTKNYMFDVPDAEHLLRIHAHDFGYSRKARPESIDGCLQVIG
jgi:hypothetical protein